jgi:hypothetical protein
MAGKKSNYIKKGVLAAHKQRKREEAAERQTHRDGRTAEQQLELLRKRPGKSRKERTRLA